jgi:hypothetical protein
MCALCMVCMWASTRILVNVVFGAMSYKRGCTHGVSLIVNERMNGENGAELHWRLISSGVRVASLCRMSLRIVFLSARSAGFIFVWGSGKDE